MGVANLWCNHARFHRNISAQWQTNKTKNKAGSRRCCSRGRTGRLWPAGREDAVPGGALAPQNLQSGTRSEACHFTTRGESGDLYEPGLSRGHCRVRRSPALCVCVCVSGRIINQRLTTRARPHTTLPSNTVASVRPISGLLTSI